MSTEKVDWRNLFFEYLTNPGEYWDSNRSYQLKKIRRKMDKLCEKSRLDGLSFPDWIIEKAIQRQKLESRALFLISCGSSGSHWLEAMLADDSSFLACGEVYLPKSILSALKEFEKVDAELFMDAIHILHSEGDRELIDGATFINSAHRSGFYMSSLMDSCSKTLLLLRDPADIVVSRTYRKQSYKSLVSSETSDLEYLQENIVFVQDFYQSAFKSDVDIKIKYEDLREHSVGEMKKLLKLLGISRADEEIRAIYQDYSPEAQVKKSNIYKGPQVDIPDEVKNIVKHELKYLRRKLGYHE